MTEKIMVAHNGVLPHHPIPEIFVPSSRDQKTDSMVTDLLSRIAPKGGKPEGKAKALTQG